MLAEPERLIALNRTCECLPLERAAIDAGIVAGRDVPGLRGLLAARPHLFAGTSVFVSEVDASAMQAQIEALEAVAKLDGYRTEVLTRAGDEIVDAHPQTRGVLMGYDFHITADGPRLIEVNTNAGGAFLVAAMENALGMDVLDARTKLTDMFLSEWHRARPSGAPRNIVIVDETPEEQYLYPDMLLAKEMLERAGIETHLADPSELAFEGERLLLNDHPVDMIYNRLTDFALTNPEHRALREALLSDAVVITPAPHHHALHADKRNLALLSDARRLEIWGLSSRHINTLKYIPYTELVTPETADELWSRRKQLFFKPASGFGSRATYRGSKLTRRVWEEIVSGDYVAQAFVPPTHRAVTVDGAASELKFDVRVYTYDREPLLMAARVYQGQTTNFRTAGGGFAPVLTSPFSID